MNKTDIKWYNPEKFEKAIEIHLKNPLIVPVGGSTGILRTKKHKFEGFINLKDCNLSYIKEGNISNGNQNSNLKEKENKSLIIGSTTTFNEIISYLKTKKINNNSFENMLLSSLISAASYPLRNRITIGGSLYDLPIWSDIISCLLLVNTNIKLNYDTDLDLLSYIEKRKKIPHIIKEIEIKYDDTLQYFTERFSLTNFDYAVLRVSISCKINKNKIDYFNLAIGGTKEIVFYNKEFNKNFIGLDIKDEEGLNKIINSTNFGFSTDYRFDSDYKENIAKTIIKDIIKKFAMQ